MKPTCVAKISHKFGILGAIALALPTTTAHAQYDGSAYAFPVPDYMTGMIGSSNLSNVYSSGKGKSGKSSSSKSKRARATRTAPKIATAAQRNKLFFTPSAAVTKQSNQQFINFLEGRIQSSRPQIEKEVNSGAFRRMFGTIIGPTQLSSNNVADVLSAYMVVSWGILKGKPNVGRPLDRAGTRAVQSSLRNHMALDRAFQSLTNDKKQRFTEDLANLTALYVLQSAEFRKNNNQTSIKRLKDDVRVASRQRTGIDLSKIRFDSKGFNL